MRLTTVILIASILQVSASSFAQKFSYVKKGAPLSQLFREIKKQTGYTVLWNSTVDVSLVVDANFKKTPLEDVLKQCLTEHNLSFKIENKTISIKPKERPFLDKLIGYFTLIDVRGRVVDERNEPLVGAVIRIKGTQISTSTNSNGEFLLRNVDNKAVLVISFLGYEQQEIIVTEKMSEVKLVMSEDRLKEVEINAGYYTVKERERTGNISRIAFDVIEKNPVNNALMALQNRVPGLQITQQTGTPGGGVKVQIRGRSSINANIGNDPLYIVDGVIYPSTSITSSLTPAILGGSGASPLGLINPNDLESIEVLKDADATAIYGSRGANGVILIKTKKGVAGKTRFAANVSQGYSKVDRRLKLMNTEQYIEMRNESFKNDGLTPGVRDYDVNGTWDVNKYTDWQKELIGGTANTTMVSSNVSGGSSTLTCLIGGNYYQEGTVFPGDFGFKRGGMNANLNFGSTESRFNLNFIATYSNAQYNLLTSDLTSNILLAPNAPDLYDENGMLNWSNNTVYTNPMSNLLRSNTKGTDNLNANVVVSYKLLKRLFIKASIGYSATKGTEFSKTPLTSRSPALTSTAANRAANFNNNSNSTLMAEPQINYDVKLGPGNLKALVGMTFQGNTSELRSIRGTGFNSDAQLDNIAAAGTITTVDAASGEYRYSALFSRLNYELNNKYFLNITARRDGSSRFGKGKQFANFGAVGAAWIFGDEKWIKESIPFLSFGKIRSSYGITGNDQIGNYGYLQLWNSLSGTYQGVPTVQPAGGSVGNSDFAWENNRKLEAALQLGFLNNNINFELSWYRNRSSNQLIGDPLPPSTGKTSITANRNATVQNTGLEFTSDFKILNKNDLQWNLGVNVTIPRNKLIAYPGIESSADAYTYIVGQPLSIERIYNVRGIDPQTGLYDIEDLDGNGILNDLDRYKQKFTGQYFYGGVSNSIRIKQFDFDFLIGFTKQNASGNYMGAFNPGRWDFSGPTTNQPEAVVERWRNPGDETNISKAGNASATVLNYSRARATGGASISDASFIRLKNISLYYNLPKTLLKSLKIQNAKVGLQGQNILTWTNYVGLDPETQSMLLLPPLRTLSIGLNVSL
ncbi:SusC/RagA family TonB-linked outer membrane protein [Pedobacter africanus]|uniref:TonB-linked SusC/RagA family outer membrane protein n=1 Tax=Pedobacter africanus TaxID=151894 RepID=A0ACC6KT23_9SPHI|nr:SusC/RagA family TonB-linked outer membrane protein [Pedobacter africanus]MDR6782342.1 TonB-linked SusC/RagA family outer membrane protein [Pedobacter africanus]